MPDTLNEQLIKHLADLHSIEEQALLQMKVALRMARDPELAEAFRYHIGETPGAGAARSGDGSRHRRRRPQR